MEPLPCITPTGRISDSKPDIICVTEVKAKNFKYEVPDSAFNISEYDIFRSNEGRGITILHCYTPHAQFN